MFNQIHAELLPTEFCSEPHLVVTIDGAPLDQFLVDATNNDNFRGLIPAWLDDLDDPSESKVVWDRIQRPVGTRTNVPILIFPDDLDLWCSAVLAETTFAVDSVTWHALDFDAGGSDGLPDSIGTDVNWQSGVGPFHFARSNYDACVAKFRLNLEASAREHGFLRKGPAGTPSLFVQAALGY